MRKILMLLFICIIGVVARAAVLNDNKDEKNNYDSKIRIASEKDWKQVPLKEILESLSKESNINISATSEISDTKIDLSFPPNQTLRKILDRIEIMNSFTEQKKGNEILLKGISKWDFGGVNGVKLVNEMKWKQIPLKDVLDSLSQLTYRRFAATAEVADIPIDLYCPKGQKVEKILEIIKDKHDLVEEWTYEKRTLKKMSQINWEIIKENEINKNTTKNDKFEEKITTQVISNEISWRQIYLSYAVEIIEKENGIKITLDPEINDLRFDLDIPKNHSLREVIDSIENVCNLREERKDDIIVLKKREEKDKTNLDLNNFIGRITENDGITGIKGVALTLGDDLSTFAISDANGYFFMNNIKQGNYILKAMSKGYYEQSEFVGIVPWGKAEVYLRMNKRMSMDESERFEEILMTTRIPFVIDWKDITAKEAFVILSNVCNLDIKVVNPVENTKLNIYYPANQTVRRVIDTIKSMNGWVEDKREDTLLIIGCGYHGLIQEIKLSKVYGVITEADGENGIEGATITLGDDMSTLVLTDNRGRFVMNEVKPSSYILKIVKKGYSLNSEIIEVKNGEDFKININMAKTD